MFHFSKCHCRASKACHFQYSPLENIYVGHHHHYLIYKTSHNIFICLYTWKRLYYEVVESLLTDSIPVKVKIHDTQDLTSLATPKLLQHNINSCLIWFDACPKWYNKVCFLHRHRIANNMMIITSYPYHLIIKRSTCITAIATFTILPSDDMRKRCCSSHVTEKESNLKISRVFQHHVQTKLYTLRISTTENRLRVTYKNPKH